MTTGFTKLIRSIKVFWDVKEFCLRKRILGFENANAFFRRLDKDSILPILVKNGATIGVNCDIEAPLIFHNCSDFSNLIIGNNCHVGKNCFFDLRDKVIIEDNAVISMQCTFITHTDINKSELRKIYASTQAPICIGRNTYIGANSTVLEGVRIGENSILAAGSVVIEYVPPYTMVGGVPAKIIKNLVKPESR